MKNCRYKCSCPHDNNTRLIAGLIFIDKPVHRYISNINNNGICRMCKLSPHTSHYGLLEVVIVRKYLLDQSHGQTQQ